MGYREVSREASRVELEGSWSFEVVDGRIAVRDMDLIRSVLEARRVSENLEQPRVPVRAVAATPGVL